MQDFESVHARKFHIQHDQVIGPVARFDQADFPVVHNARFVPIVFEGPRQMGGESDFVLDHKNSHAPEYT
jgi:hypothetical protein